MRADASAIGHISISSATSRLGDPEEKLFTWWSYRARDWAASDRGRRLDHIWLSPALAGSLITAEVRRDARGWEGPSDHVPVTVELEVPS